MPQHLSRDLEYLKKELLLLGAMVEEAANKAILTLTERRADLADEVILGDKEVDAREVALEEDCLKVLALHHPVANDLRFVMAIIKVNNDLERVGDLARSIAERGKALPAGLTMPPEIHSMADTVREMLRDGLNAVIQGDTGLARKVLKLDDEVDSAHKAIYSVVKDRIREDVQQIDGLIQILSVSRYLERMADYATNIAEDVVFMVDGEVIRHQASQ